ncbi:MAG TPA: hypothetical protein VNC50_18995 [Planctomycetia bacterium]|nr:hypothetical protein [Planctomycetia bacterium]
MPNSKEILARLFELRKEYKDDEEDPTYLALHHACLFISYRIGEFEAYCREAERVEADRRERDD